jgi:hypothetical protein
MSLQDRRRHAQLVGVTFKAGGDHAALGRGQLAKAFLEGQLQLNQGTGRNSTLIFHARRLNQSPGHPLSLWISLLNCEQVFEKGKP